MIKSAMKFFLHLFILAVVTLLLIAVPTLAAPLSSRSLRLSAQDALRIFLPSGRLSSRNQDVTGKRSGSVISTLRSEGTSKSQNHRNFKRADKGIGDDPAIIRLPRLTHEEITSALTPDELDRFYELRDYNAEYTRVRETNQKNTMSKENYDRLKSGVNDYREMLRLIRQRLVEAGQASWQTATELKLLPGERAGFSPEELGWVLSPDEQREWDRLSEGSNALMGLYRKKYDGGKLAPEEEEQIKLNRELNKQKQVMRRDILKRLVASSKATPERVARWKTMLINEKVVSSARRAAATIENKKKETGKAAKEARRKARYDADIARMRQLAALEEQAIEEERQELAALRAKRLPKNASPQKQRLKKIKAKVENQLPLTPEEQKEWNKAVTDTARYNQARREKRKRKKAETNKDVDGPSKDKPNPFEMVISNSPFQASAIPVRQGSVGQWIGQGISSAGNLLRDGLNSLKTGIHEYGQAPARPTMGAYRGRPLLRIHR